MDILSCETQNMKRKRNSSSQTVAQILTNAHISEKPRNQDIIKRKIGILRTSEEFPIDAFSILGEEFI